MDSRITTLIPFESIEYEAQQQIFKLLKFPFLKRLSIFPDIHKGYLMPVGSVAIFDNAISPYGVGYDIGCGMCGIMTSIPYSEICKSEKKIFEDLYKIIPCGVGSENYSKDDRFSFILSMFDKKFNATINSKLNSQFGTLGSGNHFIELGYDSDKNLTIVLHSGSRKPGYLVAQYYINLAKKNDTKLPGDFLDFNSDFGKAYYTDMNCMLLYALENRLKMLKDILHLLGLNYKNYKIINENHNHAADLGDGNIIHRKGATPAEYNEFGLIPGNMRDGTYITIGLGNDQYLKSSSHGAGRKIPRKHAKDMVNLDIFKKQMKGIYAITDINTIDEAPSCYKKLDDVIAMQEGIVIKTITKTTPRIVIKGY